MDKKTKIRFVREFTASVRDTMIEKIKDGKVPEEWDGVELRERLADLCNDKRGYMSADRARAYANTVATTTV